MGSDAQCTAHFGGQRSDGKALLETDHSIFRGEFRLAIPRKAITEVDATDGTLRVTFPDGTARFELGPAAAKWADKIRNPPSLLDKLGVKPGMRVAVLGVHDESFLAQLADLVEQRQDVSWIAAGVPREDVGLRRVQHPPARCGEFGHRRSIEALEPDLVGDQVCNPCLPIRHPEHHQQPYVAMVPHRRGQCMQGGVIGVLGVIDHDERRGCDPVHEMPCRRDRFGGHLLLKQLAQHRPGRVGLPNGGPGPTGTWVLVGEPAQQCALADAGLTDDRDDVRAAGRGRYAPPVELGQLPIAPDARRGHDDHRPSVAVTAR